MMATRSIPALRFNRIVQLQRRTVTRDSFGGEIESWSEVEKVWASVNALDRQGPGAIQMGQAVA